MEISQSKKLSFTICGIGCVLIFLGVLFSSYFVADRLSPDGQVEELTIRGLQNLRILTVSFGILAVLFGILVTLSPTVFQRLSDGIQHRCIFLSSLLVLFCLIGTYLLFYHSFPSCRGETDGFGYMERASGLFFQEHSFHAPGYSWAIRIVHITGLSHFASAKVVSLIFGVIFVWVSWLIVSSSVNSRETRLAMVFIVLNPIVLWRSVTIMSDMMGASLFLCALALILVPQQSRNQHFLFAGILGGMAYLTRYVYIIVLFVPIIFLLFNLTQKRKWIKSLREVLVFCGGFLLATSPWFLFLYRTKGNPFWNQNYLNVAFKLYGISEGWNAFPSGDKYTGWLDVVFYNPLLFAKSYMMTFASLPWRLLDLIPRVGVIGSFGFFVWLSTFNMRKKMLLSACTVYGLVVSLVWLESRFLLPFVPLVAMFVASGLCFIPASFSPELGVVHSRRLVDGIPLRIAAITLSIVLMVLLLVKTLSSNLRNQPLEYKRAAAHLRDVGEQNISVMAAKPHIAYFSKNQNIDFRSHNLQDLELESLPKILRKANLDYFVYDERYGSDKFPQFRLLLDPNSNPYPRLLEPILVLDAPRRLVVYKYKERIELK